MSVIGLAVLLAGGISLLIGLDQSIWFDEAYSILLAEHSWREIVELTVVDVHPPLYYWMLKAWTVLFGTSELAVRSLSTLFLGLSVGVAGLLVKRLFGVRVALFALPFIVFAPFLLRYGFEVRMYAFVSFIGIAATYALVMAVEAKQRRRRWMLFAAYSLLVALGVYTLYLMSLVWVAHSVWVSWLVLRERRRDLIVPGLTAYVNSVVLFLPWLVFYVSRSGSGVETLSPVTSSLGLDDLIGMVTFMFSYQPPWQWGEVMGVAVICIVAAVLLLGLRAYKSASAFERRYLALFMLYFTVPVAILAIATQFLPIYLERYIAQFAIGGYIAIGLIAALALERGRLGRRIAVAGIGVVLLAGCMSLAEYGNYNFQRLHKPSVKQAAALLGECKNGAIIFADGPQIAMELDYYVKDCPVRFFNETLEMGGGFAMLSGSPLRVADASIEFKNEDKLLYVYYDQPKRALPAHLKQVGVEELDALYVATYQRADVH